MPEDTVLYQGNTSNNHSQKSHCVSYVPSCGWSVYVLVGVSLSDCKNWADCTKLNWEKSNSSFGSSITVIVAARIVSLFGVLCEMISELAHIGMGGLL